MVAREHRLEGIVSKRVDSVYLPGRRSPAWIKTPLRNNTEVVVAGWTPGAGGFQGTFGSLVLGAYDDSGRFVYIGNVGTGFTQKVARDLRALLEPLERPTSPFAGKPPHRDAHWVEPRLVAEVELTEWTADGRARHPSFKGLRKDKPAADVVRERPVATTTDDKPVVAGLAISNPARVMYPALGLTKLAIARYLEAVAPWMLPHVAGRPLTLVWCPKGLDGGCRYMRHSKVWGPDALRRTRRRRRR